MGIPRPKNFATETLHLHNDKENCNKVSLILEICDYGSTQANYFFHADKPFY